MALGFNFLKSFSSLKDFILSVGILLTIVITVTPIPSYGLDIGITLNLCFSLIFIIASVYIPSIVKIASFPSALLLVTTYRLALHVAASRLILTKGYAGAIIDSFGRYAAGGSFVVGGVVFLVITILQFVVIVKGAERISEVAARFALDAMPAKQMAIEVDTRSGALNAKQARQKRSEIQQESQLFGSMDGALKFVKGDAIAGLIVAVVNILGGTLIGMLVKNLPAGEAAKKYLLLTIGEGLVSQMSALLVTVAAGIMITKVTADTGGEKKGLAEELTSQLFNLPTPLMISGFFMSILGLVPGMPWYIFIPMGMLLLYYGRKSSSSTKTATHRPPGTAFKDAKQTGHAFIEGKPTAMAKIVPAILEAGSELSDIVLGKTGAGMNFMEEMIPKMRLALYNDVGVSFPGLHVNINNNVVKTDEYSILLNEIPVFTGKIIKGYILVNETEEELAKYNIDIVENKNNLGMPICWTSERNKSILDNLSIKTWNVEESVTLAISLFYLKYAESFIGIQESKAIISFAEQDYPDLVKETMRLLPIQKISEILKRLISEGISIKDIRSVLEAIVENAQTEKSPVILVEYIRENLSRAITFKASKGSDIISAYIIDPETEDLIRSNIKETSDGSYLSLSPEYSSSIIKSAEQVISSSETPVIITTMDIRRFVHKIISSSFPNVFVISYQELEHNVETKPIGTISA